jgi:hypothetical protein
LAVLVVCLVLLVVILEVLEVALVGEVPVKEDILELAIKITLDVLLLGLQRVNHLLKSHQEIRIGLLHPSYL